MRTKFFAIGLALVLPMMAFSQATTQKPPQTQPRPATTPATQQQPRPAPTTQPTRPAVQPMTPATAPTVQPARPTTQQPHSVTAAQQAERQANVADEAARANREQISLEPAERGGGRPYRELLEEKERMGMMHFSEQELEPRFLSTLLWEVSGGQTKEEAEVVRTTGADGVVNTVKRPNTSGVLDVYVVTRDYIALYNRERQVLELITKISDESMRKTIFKGNEFAERAPLTLIYVSSNRKLARIPVNKRDFYAAMNCGMATQAAYLFCASEHLVTTTMEVDPIAVGRVLGLKMDKVLLAQPVGVR